MHSIALNVVVCSNFVATVIVVVAWLPSLWFVSAASFAVVDQYPNASVRMLNDVLRRDGAPNIIAMHVVCWSETDKVYSHTHTEYPVVFLSGLRGSDLLESSGFVSEANRVNVLVDIDCCWADDLLHTEVFWHIICKWIFE